jgi:hypothetical protein
MSSASLRSWREIDQILVAQTLDVDSRRSSRKRLRFRHASERGDELGKVSGFLIAA